MRIIELEQYIMNHQFLRNGINPIKSRDHLKNIYERKCPFDVYCRNCSDLKRRNCCLYLKYFYSQDHKKKVDNMCQKCAVKNICNEILNFSYKPEAKLNISYNFDHDKLLKKISESKRYIPRIEICSEQRISEQLEILNQFNYNVVCISLENLLKKPRTELRLSTLSEKYPDLHNRIGFNRKILLLTNIHDEFCQMSFNNHDKFIDIIEKLNPDYVTTADGTFYYSLPYAILEDQYIKMINLNCKMNSLNSSKLIGLLPPNLYLINRSMRYFYKSGFKFLGLPIMELSKNRTKVNNSYIKKLNTQIVNFAYGKSFQTIAISRSPSKIDKFNYFTSLSWKIHGDYLEKLNNYCTKAKNQSKSFNFARKSIPLEVYM